jgi:hypothetical protein
MTWDRLSDLMTREQRELKDSYERLLEQKEMLEVKKSNVRNLITQYKYHLKMNRKRIEDIEWARMVERGASTLDDMISDSVANVSDVVLDAVQQYVQSNQELAAQYREEEHLWNKASDMQKEGQSNKALEQYENNTKAIWEELMNDSAVDEEDIHSLPVPPQHGLAIPPSSSQRAVEYA